jgi:hypothetical protein
MAARAPLRSPHRIVGRVGRHRLEETQLGREVLAAVWHVDRRHQHAVDDGRRDAGLVVELGVNEERAVGRHRLPDQQRHPRVTLGSVPVRPVARDVADGLGDVVDGGLDLLKAQDIRLLALDESRDLVLPRADPVDVPGGDLHARAALIYRFCRPRSRA